MKKIIALVVLVVSVVGLAHVIETSARPETGKTGTVQHGEEGHAH
jgi:hypothetical protein